jgi:hypothetical protein
VLIAFGVATTQTLLDPQRRFEAIQKVESYLRSPPSPQAAMREALERAHKIIERDYPNGQLAIDIRAALSAQSAGPSGKSRPRL